MKNRVPGWGFHGICWFWDSIGPKDQTQGKVRNLYLRKNYRVWKKIYLRAQGLAILLPYAWLKKSYSPTPGARFLRCLQKTAPGPSKPYNMDPWAPSPRIKYKISVELYTLTTEQRPQKPLGRDFTRFTKELSWVPGALLTYGPISQVKLQFYTFENTHDFRGLPNNDWSWGQWAIVGHRSNFAIKSSKE